MSLTSETTADAAARALARWLAPYLADELGLATPQPHEATSFDARFDQATCALFVSSLGDVVLNNAEAFFELLVRDGEVGSIALAEALNVDGPRNVPSILTTPMKRRAKALSLPYPWHEAATPDNRTLWLDPTGTCKRMLEAIRNEQNVRTTRAGR